MIGNLKPEAGNQKSNACEPYADSRFPDFDFWLLISDF
jgi:hypothetical protein